MAEISSACTMGLAVGSSVGNSIACSGPTATLATAAGSERRDRDLRLGRLDRLTGCRGGREAATFVSAEASTALATTVFTGTVVVHPARQRAVSQVINEKGACRADTDNDCDRGRKARDPSRLAGFSPVGSGRKLDFRQRLRRRPSGTLHDYFLHASPHPRVHSLFRIMAELGQ